MKTTSSEIKFLNHLKKYPNQFILANKDAVQEGFEYYHTKTYKQKDIAVKSRFGSMIRKHPPKDLFKLFMTMKNLLPSILKNIKMNYTDLNDYFNHIEHHENILTPKVYDKNELWQQLQSYAWNNHKAIVGFTKLPNAYVFKGKGVPFSYALVFIQEMDKEAIEKSPQLDAGMEVMKVYNTLGIATNDIAKWLRTTFQITCMANHPLGGLVDTVPLAAKAGLGTIGHNGLLITKEFGPRCRISPIFVNDPIVNITDTTQHEWIHDFCKQCHNCQRQCLTQAIYDAPQLSKIYTTAELPHRFESYDRDQCYISFSENMGCGICISACPFSKNPEIYDTLKKKIKGSKHVKTNISKTSS